jgi:Amt family ammonium transporter
MILWYGWFGFNPGSALVLGIDAPGSVAATAAVSTALSGAAGGVSALFTNLFLEERSTGEPKFDLAMCFNGVLSGLVAITSGCGVVEPWAAVIIGIVSGWVYMWSANLLIRLRIDDAVDAIPVHMFNGIWGVLATGFVASPRLMEAAYGTGEYPGLFYALTNGTFRANLLGTQVILVIFICGWTLFTMMPFFIWLNYKGWLRADSLEELVGLDISYHGGTDIKDGSVKKEYVEAFRRHKGALRNSRRQTSTINDSDGGWEDSGRGGRRGSAGGDPDLDQEAAAEEAYRAGE